MTSDASGLGVGAYFERLEHGYRHLAFGRRAAGPCPDAPGSHTSGGPLRSHPLRWRTPAGRRRRRHRSAGWRTPSARHAGRATTASSYRRKPRAGPGAQRRRTYTPAQRWRATTAPVGRGFDRPTRIRTSVSGAKTPRDWPDYTMGLEPVRIGGSRSNGTQGTHRLSKGDRPASVIWPKDVDVGTSECHRPTASPDREPKTDGPTRPGRHRYGVGERGGRAVRPATVTNPDPNQDSRDRAVGDGRVMSTPPPERSLHCRAGGKVGGWVGSWSRSVHPV